MDKPIQPHCSKNEQLGTDSQDKKYCNIAPVVSDKYIYIYINIIYISL